MSAAKGRSSAADVILDEIVRRAALRDQHPTAGSGGSVVLWLPIPPDNANARESWRKALAVKKRYLVELDTRLETRHHCPPAVPPAPARARLDIAFFRGGRKIDEDNAKRRCKPLVDWLVRRGYLAGDDPDRLDYPQIAQLKRTPEVPALCTVRVTITPLES